MTSVWSRVAMAGAALAGVAQVGASSAVPGAKAPQQRGGPAARTAELERDTPVPALGPAPASVRGEIGDIVRSFDGTSGISVISLRDGWEARWNADRLFPQQSCSKLWVAITALDAVDRGRITLDDPVTLTPADLTLFHQPIAEKVLNGGSHRTTLGSLLFQAITASDNTANDRLTRAVGGPPKVRAMIQRKSLGGIRFYEGERALQSRIAGLAWKQRYSLNGAFYQARAALPMKARKAAFERYLSDPYDGASPHAIASALARLKRGELLSPVSTARLLSTMAQTRTGGMRVRAALAPGWTWNHKTGTGQQLGTRTGGINDIGLLTAPDGSIYAMAIMTIPNRVDGSAQQLMQSVTRAVIAQHQTRPRTASR